jgi:hypothetical protein
MSLESKARAMFLGAALAGPMASVDAQAGEPRVDVRHAKFEPARDKNLKFNLPPGDIHLEDELREILAANGLQIDRHGVKMGDRYVVEFGRRVERYRFGTDEFTKEDLLSVSEARSVSLWLGQDNKVVCAVQYEDIDNDPKNDRTSFPFHIEIKTLEFDRLAYEATSLQQGEMRGGLHSLEFKSLQYIDNKGIDTLRVSPVHTSTWEAPSGEIFSVTEHVVGGYTGLVLFPRSPAEQPAIAVSHVGTPNL